MDTLFDGRYQTPPLIRYTYTYHWWRKMGLNAIRRYSGVSYGCCHEPQSSRVVRPHFPHSGGSPTDKPLDLLLSPRTARAP